MKTFSPRAKKILGALAQDEARKYGSKQIFPEHVILAIMNQKDSVARYAIVNLLKDTNLIDKFHTELNVLFEAESSYPTLDEIKKGDIVISKPGEKIAVDGEILLGEAHLDEAFITGESKKSKKNI